MLQLALPSFMPATRSLGRGRWQLLEPWQFELNAETYTIPRLFITDLFSVPWPLTVLLPKDLDDNRPALPHDYIFATGGLRQTANDSPLVTLATANEVIALAMKMCRFKSSTQWAVNTGLRIGSRPVWNRLLAEGWSIKNPLLAQRRPRGGISGKRFPLDICGMMRNDAEHAERTHQHPAPQRPAPYRAGEVERAQPFIRGARDGGPVAERAGAASAAQGKGQAMSAHQPPSVDVVAENLRILSDENAALRAKLAECENSRTMAEGFASTFKDERDVAIARAEKMKARVLIGEHSDNCPFCAENHPAGHRQVTGMCHLCNIESERDSLIARAEKAEMISRFDLADAPGVDACITSLSAQVAELREDKARLDWLESQLNNTTLSLAHCPYRSNLDGVNADKFDPKQPFYVGNSWNDQKGATLRAAIDAARPGDGKEVGR